jgi:hypothetical protein
VALLWISAGNGSVMVRPCSSHAVLTGLVRPRVSKAGVAVGLNLKRHEYIRSRSVASTHTYQVVHSDEQWPLAVILSSYSIFEASGGAALATMPSPWNQENGPA